MLRHAERASRRSDKLPTEWTSDAKGEFTFHAPDDAVLEATLGTKRGIALVDRNVAVSKHLDLKLADLPPRDLAIAGRVTDASGSPMPDVLVRALSPTDAAQRRRRARSRCRVRDVRSTDGSVRSSRASDQGKYQVEANADDYAPAVALYSGGERNASLVLDGGALLAGTVATTDHTPVPSFTLLVFKKDGASRDLVTSRAVIDPTGRFAVHAHAGEYELIASAAGWASSQPVNASPGDAIELVVTQGAVLRGTSGVRGLPINQRAPVRARHRRGARRRREHVTRERGNRDESRRDVRARRHSAGPAVGHDRRRRLQPQDRVHRPRARRRLARAGDDRAHADHTRRAPQDRAGRPRRAPRRRRRLAARPAGVPRRRRQGLRHRRERSHRQRRRRDDQGARRRRRGRSASAAPKARPSRSACNTARMRSRTSRACAGS